MSMSDQTERDAPTGADLVKQLQDAGELGGLFARIDAGELELTGDGGFIPALIKAALERGLQAGRGTGTHYLPHRRSRGCVREWYLGWEQNS